LTTEGRGVQSIEVGARLLEVIAATGGAMMLRDIAKAGNVAPAQAHAYLVSFRKCSLVEQDDRTGLYRLGPLALQLGLARLRSFDPLKAASDAVIEFAAETGLSVAIAVWGSYGPTVVQMHEGADQIHINTRPGTVYSLTGTATGRVFCAHILPDVVAAAIKSQQAEKLKSRFVGSVEDLKSIEAEIAFVREHGYAPIASNPVPGISAVSAPIFEVGGQLTGAITVIGPAKTLDLDPTGRSVQQCLELADAISARAGFTIRRTAVVKERLPGGKNGQAKPGRKATPARNADARAAQA